MDCRKILNQFALKFITSYHDDPIYIPTCVSEKYLWESDHLSPKWPHTLLWTVVYFVMKYFKLSTVEEHKALELKNLFKRETVGRAKGKQSYFFYFLRETGGWFQCFVRFIETLNLETQYCKRQLLPDKNPSRCPVEIMKLYLSKW
uniref:ZMYM2-like/QRICH1 C-terminal domain-containing protein n=1 Tax=Photinus pyralis TaxID=7054 RepID=A0A1Y1KI28_PHOPY